MPAVNGDLLAAVDDYLMNVLPEGWGVIKADGLAEALAEDPPFIVDVRQPDEFAGGRIEGAVNIPIQEIRSRVDELGSPEGPIVVYCHSGNRSHQTKLFLESQGFERVYDLGSYRSW